MRGFLFSGIYRLYEVYGEWRVGGKLRKAGPLAGGFRDGFGRGEEREAVAEDSLGGAVCGGCGRWDHSREEPDGSRRLRYSTGESPVWRRKNLAKKEELGKYSRSAISVTVSSVERSRRLASFVTNSSIQK